jgi:hypothetical protein
MNLRLATLLGASLLGLSLASCAHKAEVTSVASAPKEETTPCVAEILEVKKEQWDLRTMGPAEQVVARGDYQIAIRYLEPTSYAGTVRRMCAYDEREISVAGQLLRVGDRVSFLAPSYVLLQSVAPDTFSNLHEVKRVEKREANQALQPTAPSGRG